MGFSRRSAAVQVRRPVNQRGFSLVEVLVAMNIAVVGVGAIAHLSVLAIRTADVARTTTVAAVIAHQKMEQLRGLAWGIDRSGIDVTDTTTNVASEGSSDGVGLKASPSDVLFHNTPGYCDFVDGAGQSLGEIEDPPAGAAYLRRWSVTPLPGDPENTLILEVVVMPLKEAAGANARTRSVRRPGEVCLLSVKTRKAS